MGANSWTRCVSYKSGCRDVGQPIESLPLVAELFAKLLTPLVHVWSVRFLPEWVAHTKNRHVLSR